MPSQRIDQIGGHGLNSDLGPFSLPPNAWTDAQHVIPRDGKARCAWNPKLAFSVEVMPKFRFSFLDSLDRQYLIVSDGIQVQAYTIDGFGENITPEGGTATNRVTMCNHNGVLVYNSVSDGPFYWPGPGNKLQPMTDTGWPDDWRCDGMASFKYYLVAYGMYEREQVGQDRKRYQHKIRWSNSSVEGTIPNQWIPAATNDAGDDILGETSGPLIGTRLVQDQLWIIKTDAVYSLSYIGLPAVLANRRLNGVFRIGSEEATAEFKGSLVLLSGDDLYSYDGAQTTSLTKGKVSERLKESLVVGGASRGDVFLSGDNRYLWVLGKGSSDGAHSEALVMETTTGAWGHVALNSVYGLENVVTTTPGGGRNTAVLAFERSGSGWRAVYMTDDGTGEAGKVSRITRAQMPIAGADTLSMLTQVWPEVNGAFTGSFSFTATGPTAGVFRTDGPLGFTSSRDYAVFPRITGRHIGWTMETSDNGPWEIGSLTLRLEPAGDH
jgi:hypothetical protein